MELDAAAWVALVVAAWLDDPLPPPAATPPASATPASTPHVARADLPQWIPIILDC